MDTIAAISSAVGPAARMIVRASGAGVGEILAQLCPSLQSAGASRSVLSLRPLALPVWVYRFFSPKSYTGEDLVELHIPGNPLLGRMVLDRLIALGARGAEPGEFTARAYFNGRIDLSQAEGVAAVVAAGNQAELDAGRRLMAGELTRRLRPAMEKVAQTLSLIEAEIDFSDQDVRFLAADEVTRRVSDVEEDLAKLLYNSARLARLSHEPSLALVGRPNAGKSTLLNALSGSDRAVVSAMAGTTRDALSAPVTLNRGIVRMIDMAGMEQDAAGDEIAAAMRRRALIELERADVVILVREASDDSPALQLPRQPDLVVRTKIDLPRVSLPPGLSVSAISGIGLDRLRQALDAIAFGGSFGQAAELALTARHVLAIDTARQALERARFLAAAELIAAELRGALDALGEVLGEVLPDQILGRIFSTFCIGK